jgi:hypothetical protein
MGVKVFVAHNEQCRLYALGVLNDYGMFCDPKTITMVIHQPRLEHVDEETISIEELESWAENEAKPAAADALAQLDLVPNAGQLSKNTPGELPVEIMEQLSLTPGEKQCKFCNAKSFCPALKAEMAVTIGHIATADDFADLVQKDDDDLELMMLKVPLVESFCKAIRGEVERRLFLGHESKNFKLVAGRQGNRAWIDEEQATGAMKANKMKPDDMFEKKLISPTKAEKLLKSKKPKVWEDLQKHIIRAPGKPSVALVTDKRPAMGASLIAEFRDLVQHDSNEEE